MSKTEIIIGIPFNIVAFDREGKVILLVEVKPRPPFPKQASGWFLERVVSYLKDTKFDIPFAMLVTLDSLEIFDLNPRLNLNYSNFNSQEMSFLSLSGSKGINPAASFATEAILSYYEPDFKEKQIFYDYLVGLVEAWLHDLAYDRKEKLPPACEQIERIGLLNRLKDGTIRSGEVFK